MLAAKAVDDPDGEADLVFPSLSNSGEYVCCRRIPAILHRQLSRLVKGIPKDLVSSAFMSTLQHKRSDRLFDQISFLKPFRFVNHIAGQTQPKIKRGMIWRMHFGMATKLDAMSRYLCHFVGSSRCRTQGCESSLGLNCRKFEITVTDCTELLEIEESRSSDAFVDAAHVFPRVCLHVGLNSLEEACGHTFNTWQRTVQDLEEGLVEISFVEPCRVIFKIRRHDTYYSNFSGTSSACFGLRSGARRASDGKGCAPARDEIRIRQRTSMAFRFAYAREEFSRNTAHVDRSTDARFGK